MLHFLVSSNNNLKRTGSKTKDIGTFPRLQNK